MVNVKHRIRYPPFEPAKLNANHIPIVEHSFEVEGPVIPSFRLGTEDSWIVERVVEGEPELNSNYHGTTPQIIEKQRTGWYLIPHPIHAKARKFINGVVVVLLFCLFYLFTTPILDSLGIPTFGTGKVRLGMLDYPILVLIVIPLMVTPIALRVAANLGDLRRQKYFLSNAPPSPVITLDEIRSGSNLKGKIRIKDAPDDWTDLKVSWRVGILPPARHKVFAALGRNQSGQPPPGLTTTLPHHWDKGLDDGTGMGEDAPMERHDVPGGVFLRPMRIMGIGGTQSIELTGGDFELKTPEGDWPGTLYGGLVRVHWELIVNIERKSSGTLLWVYPLIVEHQNKSTVNEEIQISDGRTESDTL
tara:strand:+ start:2597 stop:3676 length:1080 start_codon:yes stop_codon:yes gene_type:complete